MTFSSLWWLSQLLETPKLRVTTTRAASGSTSRSSLIRTVWLKELRWSSTCWRNLASAIRWAPVQKFIHFWTWIKICLTQFFLCIFFSQRPQWRGTITFSTAFCQGCPKSIKKSFLSAMRHSSTISLRFDLLQIISCRMESVSEVMLSVCSYDANEAKNQSELYQFSMPEAPDQLEVNCTVRRCINKLTLAS